MRGKIAKSIRRHVKEFHAADKNEKTRYDTKEHPSRVVIDGYQNKTVVTPVQFSVEEFSLRYGFLQAKKIYKQVRRTSNTSKYGVAA